MCVCCPVILCTQSRHHLPQSRSSCVHFPNGAAHGCSDSLVLHLFFHASSKNSHTNTDRGGFFIQSKQTTFPFEISKGWRWGEGEFCTFLQGKDTLLCLCSSHQPGELMVIEWTSVEWSALRVQAKKKCRAACVHVCACDRWPAGRSV